ncbi:MAG TPA: hypothetical protein VLM85_04710 [Polyangiaceae bacterium]|nr:hypothetical protein [Polyangiaceae bacterium]
MRSLRLGLLAVAVSILAAACGGKIDGGTSSGVDSGTDSQSGPPASCKPQGGPCASDYDCCMGTCVGGACTGGTSCAPTGAKCSTAAPCCSHLCDQVSGFCAPSAPLPNCRPDGAPCGSPLECCTQTCIGNVCGGKAPPPSCQPAGLPCFGQGKCCKMCLGDVCGEPTSDGGPFVCPTTSNKLCDQCVGQACCGEMLNCGTYSSCSQWLACIHQCEQQGNTAFACAQNTCGAPSMPAETALYACVQQKCSTACNTD